MFNFTAVLKRCPVLTVNTMHCFPFSLKIWRVLTPNKRHDMYLLHSSLRSTFGTKYIDSEEKCRKKINKILLARTHQPWMKNIIPSCYNKHFSSSCEGSYMASCLGESIISGMWLSNVLKGSERALSNTSLNRSSRAFKREKHSLQLSKQLTFRESVLSEHSKHWLIGDKRKHKNVTRTL